MNSRIVGYAILPLLFLSGCIPKVETAKPISDTVIEQEVGRLSYPDSDRSLARNWWKCYGDDQLDSLIEHALNAAPSLKSIEARYVQAKAIVRSVESHDLPHVSFDSSLTHERFSENHIFPRTFLGGTTNTQYQTGVTLDYDFDFWDKRRSQILSAREEAYSELASIEAAKLALSTGIAEVYLSWNYDERRLTILSQIEQTSTQELAIAEKRYRLGLSDAAALYRGKGALQQIRQQIRALERKIEGEKESICILGGFLPSYAASMKMPNIRENAEVPIPKEVMLHLLSHRPDVIAAKHAALAKSHKIEESKARFYPDISLSGLIGFVSFDWTKFLERSSYDPSGAVVLSLPLLDWGEREALLNKSVGDYNASVYEYNQAVIKAANEVVTLLKQSSLIDSQMQMHDTQMEAIHAETMLAERRFKYALDNKLPYLAAKQTELEIETTRFELASERERIRIALIRSLGGGYSEEAER